MAIVWSSLREQVRRTVLGGSSLEWPDDVLLDSAWWALTQFTAHTAVATSVSYVGVDAGIYTLPNNLYEPLDMSGLVTMTSSNKTTYLDPIFYTQGLSPGYDEGFYVEGQELHVLGQPDASIVLDVKYFGIYNRPYADNSVIDIPLWAEPALALLIGSFALTHQSTKSAMIRQWLEDPERGNPTDNTLETQSNHLVKRYEQLIGRHPKQDRTNFYRKNMGRY